MILLEGRKRAELDDMLESDPLDKAREDQERAMRMMEMGM